jgi:glycosyltransferase involved in cell wall biosynthesis
MNVLCASHTPALKGSAISLCELMKRMDRTRFLPVAVFSKTGPLVADLEKSGIKTHIASRKGFLRLGTIREALEIIDRERIDIVHVNSAVPFSKYLGIAARWRRLPVVWHIREDPHGKRVRRLKKWVRLLSTKIVVITTQQEEAFRSTGKATKIRNGVDTVRFSPHVDGRKFREFFEIPGDVFVFGIIGSIEENKGTMNFMEAARLLANSFAEAFFAVVGGGLPEDVQRLRDLVEKDPLLRARTRITGPLTAMPEVLGGLDVLVVASHWESFPRVLIESMACGKPAVAPAVGEIPRIMDSEKTGFLIPDNSVSALHQAMERCLLERGALGQMGRAAMEKARAEFSIERHVREMQAIYEEVSRRSETRRS